MFSYTHAATNSFQTILMYGKPDYAQLLVNTDTQINTLELIIQHNIDVILHLKLKIKYKDNLVPRDHQNLIWTITVF